MEPRTNEFMLGQEFKSVWGRDAGFMHNVCTQPEPNQLFCTSEERAKGWNFESTMTFSPSGMISERKFLTDGIDTKKYYQKLGDDGELLSAETGFRCVRNLRHAPFPGLRCTNENISSVPPRPDRENEGDNPFGDDTEDDEDFWDEEDTGSGGGDDFWD